MTGPAAGLYDPIKAIFYSPNRGTAANGEPDIASFTEQFRRHIRWLSMANREALVQRQTNSINVILFRVRRDSASQQIRPDWELEHTENGVVRRYGVTGINPIDYGTDELEFAARGIHPV